jgi:hypothetical protein
MHFLPFFQKHKTSPGARRRWKGYLFKACFSDHVLLPLATERLLHSRLGIIFLFQVKVMLDYQEPWKNAWLRPDKSTLYTSTLFMVKGK